VVIGSQGQFQKWPAFLETAPARQHRRLGDEVAVEQLGKHPATGWSAEILEKGARWSIFPLVYHAAITEYQAYLVVSVQERHLLLQSLGEPGIIGVQERDVFSRSMFQAQVSGGIWPPIGLRQHLRPLSKGPEHLVSAVGGTIVDNNYFVVRVRLSQNALDGVPDRLLPIVNGNNNTYLGIDRVQSALLT
jgi:hypothetical protein